MDVGILVMLSPAWGVMSGRGNTWCVRVRKRRWLGCEVYIGWCVYESTLAVESFAIPGNQLWERQSPRCPSIQNTENKKTQSMELGSAVSQMSILPPLIFPSWGIGHGYLRGPISRTQHLSPR